MHLTLFFTFDVSLQTWASSGLLHREIQLYQALVKQGIQVSFVTYGDASDYEFQEALGEIQIVPLYAFTPAPKNKLIRFAHSLFLPWFLRNHLKQSSLYKTNQIMGAWGAIFSKWLFKKPLLIRCGYDRYKNALRERKSSSFLYALKHFSNWAYHQADHVWVTSQEISEFIQSQFGLSAQKITAHSNYIDTELFHKMPKVAPQENRILYIGRFSEEKNLFALLDAVRGSDYQLDLVGKGTQETQIREYIQQQGLNVNLLGHVPNTELPALINQYPVCVLCSHFEGNPKVLLEFMSCERAVLGTKVVGIQDVIEHSKNGILCDLDADSIRAGLDSLMASKELRLKLGQAARAYVEEHCSLKDTVQQEMALYEHLVQGRHV